MAEEYIIEGGEPIRCRDPLEWAKWMKEHNTVLNHTVVVDVVVSTVFLGLDYRMGNGPPILWETMVFGGKLDMEQQRYTSRKEALDGHWRFVDRVRGSMK